MILDAAVLTEKGFVKIRDLAPDTKILQYNFDSHTCNFVIPEIEVIPYKGDMLQIGGGKRKSGLTFGFETNNYPAYNITIDRKWGGNILIPYHDIRERRQGYGSIQAAVAIGEINDPLPIDVIYLAISLFGEYDEDKQEYTVSIANAAFVKLLEEALDKEEIFFYSVNGLKKIITFKSSDISKESKVSLGFKDRSCEWAVKVLDIVIQAAGTKRKNGVYYSFQSDNPKFMDWLMGVHVLANRKADLQTITKSITIYGRSVSYNLDSFQVPAGTLLNIPLRQVKFDGSLAKVKVPSGYYFVRYQNQCCVQEAINA